MSCMLQYITWTKEDDLISSGKMFHCSWNILPTCIFCNSLNLVPSNNSIPLKGNLCMPNLHYNVYLCQPERTWRGRGRTAGDQRCTSVISGTVTVTLLRSRFVVGQYGDDTVHAGFTNTDEVLDETPLWRTQWYRLDSHLAAYFHFDIPWYCFMHENDQHNKIVCICVNACVPVSMLSFVIFIRKPQNATKRSGAMDTKITIFTPLIIRGGLPC